MSCSRLSYGGLAAASLIVAASGCRRTSGRAPPPFIQAVEPAGTYLGQPMRIAIRGENLTARATQMVGSGGRLVVDTSFRAWLDDIELSQVAFGGGGVVFAQVSADAPGGWHDLTVQTPEGQRNTKSHAFFVSDQRPASLSVSSFTLLSARGLAVIEPEEGFVAQLTVTNTGQSAALRVQPIPDPPAKTLTGGVDASTTDAQTAVDLAAGASATFSWRYTERGVGPGSVTLSASAIGVDAITGALVTASATSNPLLVQTRPALAAALDIPGAPAVGGTFTVLLTVTNSGASAVDNLTPSPLAVNGARVTCSLPTPSSATLAGGSSVTYTYRCSATGPGSLQLSATVSGIYRNDGTIVAAAATLVRIVRPAASAVALSSSALSSPNSLPPFAYIAPYTGAIYLGPGGLGAYAVRVSPDLSTAQLRFWKLEVGPGARNTVAQISGSRTIGFDGCTPNSPECGPDNENGRGLFFSGVLAGIEWLGITGSETTGPAGFLYLTNPAFPPTFDGLLDLAYVKTAQAATTLQLTAAHVFHDLLYLGFADTGRTPPPSIAPVLNVMKTANVRLPGLTASTGTDITLADVVDLQGRNLPGVGVSGIPANVTRPALMIDAIADFNDALYLGNDGGWVRSTNNSPLPCATAANCSSWTGTTPAAAAYASRASVGLSAAKIGNLEPKDHALAGMASLRGHLFAARNTNAGPQLWRCDPAISGDPNQCDPADWSIINGSARVDLSEFGDTNNGAITLLVATSTDLYVGFNNSSIGSVVYRTANPLASAFTDFAGDKGCTAPCPGLGSSLLSAAPRIFDAKAVTVGSTEYVYLTAGEGSAAVKLVRIGP